MAEVFCLLGVHRATLSIGHSGAPNSLRVLPESRLNVKVCKRKIVLSY